MTKLKPTPIWSHKHRCYISKELEEEAAKLKESLRKSAKIHAQKLMSKWECSRDPSERYKHD